MMLGLGSAAAALLLAFVKSALAQFPAEPVGRKVLESRFGEGVKIIYKEVWESKIPRNYRNSL